MAQQQCPNCGGYMTYQHQISIGGITLLQYTIGIAIIWFVGWVVIAQIINWITQLAPTLSGLIAAPCGMFGFGFSFILAAGYRSHDVNAQRESQKNVPFQYTCTLCGYNWDVRSVAPSSIRARPDLIAKGQQELQRRWRMWD